ncbi:carotenoid oxygenase family protein [Rhodococcus pyridinivorans]|uniref:carotenoid oxygenase family protein n=1 Tax=Rhodococcus pyridinivorans TaxID=103816 RepID=UPI002164064B|nr:carotenoid oxygenase family protein [Rhodococcus pyridinivorans]UVT26432.1 carotenoid oxygenase family protein [Rhodococcus pyridinivorans]
MQRPAPVDLAHHPHLSGLFAPQREEVDVRELEVHGELPADLHGSYLRNGPNPRFDPIGHYVYPIDGDGMVHRVQIAGGTARYTNRFVRTPQVVAEEKAGRALWAGITDPYFPPEEEVGPDLANTMRELPDINIVRHGGRLMAMAEAAPPYTLGSDLETLGRETFDGTLPVGLTAHPKIDPHTGEMVAFCYMLDPPYLTWSVVAPDGTVTRAPTPIDGMDRPLMIHDMALTPTYVVLVLAPLVFDLSQIFSGGSPLDWKPDLGTRVALVPRDSGAVRWFSTDTFWMWHTANAFDLPDGDVALDYVEWAYPGALTEKAGPNRSVLRRAVIGRDGVTRTTLHERDIEFPRIDDRSMTLGHSVVATIGRSRSQKLPAGAADSLFWFDVASGTEAVWAHETLSPGEPAYLSGDSGGYWGAIATDRADMTSWFLVFPETDPASGPIARVRLPIRVPAGLHGAWLPPD